MEQKFNNFPEGFKVPKLGRNKKVAFRLVEGCRPPIALPTIETINADGELIDIAVIKSQNSNGDIKFQPIEFASEIVFLHGRNNLHRKIYTQMMLSNHFEGNENRDESMRVRYRIFDPAADAKKANERKKLLVRAEAVVAEMTEKEVRSYFDAKGESSGGDIEILTERLFKIAKEHPDQFVKNKGLSQSDKVLSVFGEAKKKGIIDFKQSESSWIWKETGDSILQIPKVLKAGETRLGFFLPYIEQKEGRETYAKLKALLEEE